MSSQRAANAARCRMQPVQRGDCVTGRAPAERAADRSTYGRSIHRGAFALPPSRTVASGPLASTKQTTVPDGSAISAFTPSFITAATTSRGGAPASSPSMSLPPGRRWRARGRLLATPAGGRARAAVRGRAARRRRRTARGARRELIGSPNGSLHLLSVDVRPAADAALRAGGPRPTAVTAPSALRAPASPALLGGSRC